MIRLYWHHARAWFRSSFWSRVALQSVALVAVYAVLDRLLPPTDTPILSWPSLLVMVPMIAWVSARGRLQAQRVLWFMTGSTVLMVAGALLWGNDDLLHRCLMPAIATSGMWLLLLVLWWRSPRGVTLHLGDQALPLVASGDYCAGCKTFHWALFSSGDAIVFPDGEGAFRVDMGRTRRRISAQLAIGRTPEGRHFCPPISHIRGLGPAAWREAYGYIPLK